MLTIRNLTVTVDPKLPNASAELSRILIAKEERLTTMVGQLFVKYIRGTAEWISLTDISPIQGRNYQLSAQLGIGSTSALEQILDTWAKSFSVFTADRTANGVLHFSMFFSGVRSDYSDVLNLQAASHITKNGTAPWLKWLLIETDKVILPGFVFLSRPDKGRSQAGYMAKSKTGKSWKLADTLGALGINPDPETRFVSKIASDPDFLAELKREIINVML